MTDLNNSDFIEISKDKLTKITLEAQEKLDERKNERFKKARLDLINHITKDYSQKMLDAASKGYNQAILYSAGRAKDKSLNEDSDGNIVKFGENVWLSDILTKGENEIISELNSFFNKENKPDYHCFISIKKDFKTNELKYTIFVSWATIDTDKKNHSTTIFRGGKYNFYSKDNKNKSTYPNKNNSLKETI